MIRSIGTVLRTVSSIVPMERMSYLLCSSFYPPAVPDGTIQQQIEKRGFFLKSKMLLLMNIATTTANEHTNHCDNEHLT